MDALVELRQTTTAMCCLECGKCSAVCPLAGGTAMSPRAIARWHDSEAANTGNGVQRCLTCAACELRCPQQVNFTDYVRGLRACVPEQRPACPHGGVFQAAARLAADGRAPARDLQWLDSDLRVAREGEVGLFVGCLPLFDAVFEEKLNWRSLDIARSAVRLLNRLGVEPVVLAQERCCGHDLLWSGDRRSFQALAEANTTLFADHGVKHIVTTCAECCRTWRVDYPDAVASYRPRVEHITEFLAQNGVLPFEDGDPLQVTFQDPCRLGRHLEVYDPPRRLLQDLPGVQLVEMPGNRRAALCCGTCGFVRCDADSRRLQSARLQQAADTGAGTLVTACPKCLIHFRCAQADARRGRDRPPAVEVRDITVMLAERLRQEQQVQDQPAPGPQSSGAGREGGACD